MCPATLDTLILFWDMAEYTHREKRRQGTRRNARRSARRRNPPTPNSRVDAVDRLESAQGKGWANNGANAPDTLEKMNAAGRTLTAGEGAYRVT